MYSLLNIYVLCILKHAKNKKEFARYSECFKALMKQVMKRERESKNN